MSDHTSDLEPAVYAQALAAAQSLQAVLEERLIGRETPGWSCCCGALWAGDSKVIGVSYPSQYQCQIGMSLLWRTDLEDVHGRKWSTNITQFLGREEIYPLFRNAFAGVPIELSRPLLELCIDNPATPFEKKFVQEEGRNFVGSGRFVRAKNFSPAYVRPQSDLSNSVWVNCALHAETDLPNYDKGLLLSACIDALEPCVENGRGRWGQFRPQSVELQHTFYVVLPGKHQIFLPVARVHSIDWLGRCRGV